MRRRHDHDRGRDGQPDREVHRRRLRRTDGSRLAVRSVPEARPASIANPNASAPASSSWSKQPFPAVRDQREEEEHERPGEQEVVRDLPEPAGQARQLLDQVAHGRVERGGPGRGWPGSGRRDVQHEQQDDVGWAARASGASLADEKMRTSARRSRGTPRVRSASGDPGSDVSSAEIASSCFTGVHPSFDATIPRARLLCVRILFPRNEPVYIRPDEGDRGARVAPAGAPAIFPFRLAMTGRSPELLAGSGACGTRGRPCPTGSPRPDRPVRSRSIRRGAGPGSRR